MARLRSRIPVWEGLTPEQSAYLADLDRVIPARADLPASPTTTEIATAINTLYADLRIAGIMKRS